MTRLHANTGNTAPAVLPPLTARDRLVRAAADALHSDGWSAIRAAGCLGYRPPQALVVPVLNIPLQPDLCASHPARRGALVACVALGHELADDAATTRRCQALHAWAQAHQGTFVLFVHADDRARALAFAARWLADPTRVRALNPPPD